jgi:hypothetical protein
MHLRLMNKSDERQLYDIQIDTTGFELVTPIKPFPVAARGVGTTPVFINFPLSKLSGGKHKIKVTVTSNIGYNETQEITVVGPGK